MSVDEKERALEEQAVAEILREASRGKEREKTLGAEGWRKPAARPNKVFIGRSIASALRQTRYNEKARSRRNDRTMAPHSKTNEPFESSSSPKTKESKLNEKGMDAGSETHLKRKESSPKHTDRAHKTKRKKSRS